MTRDQVRSLWLHRAAAGKVAADPSGSLAKGRASIERQLAGGADGAVWLRRGWTSSRGAPRPSCVS